MQYRSVIALAGVSLVLSGCAGSGAEADLAAAASTVTTTQTVTAPAETVTVAPETVTVTVEAPNDETEPPSATTEDETVPEETESAADSTAIELPSDDRPLGLDDFFNHESSSWEEGRWNVANRANERGVSINLRRSTELELRLQNQFTSLRFDAGQANDSKSSECLTKVDVVVDGEVRETREFGFNMIQEFTGIDVADGNAVKIKIDNNVCDARVVLSRVQVD